MKTASAEDDASLSGQVHEERLARLAECLEHAAHLLPAQGPITVFIHHNTLHALEDLEFHEAVKKSGQIFGGQPYLSKDRYRDALRRGRIRFADLQAVLEKDLGARAWEPLPCFETRLELRLAMLQYPLLSAPTVELVWFVAENSAMRRVRIEASSAVRGRLISETRHWVMRDLRGGPDSAMIGGGKLRHSPSRTPSAVSELLDRFGESTMENWTDQDWEGFTLQALWRVCCEGVRDLPQFTTPPTPSMRHRDLLLEATGVDTDLLVHARLMPLVAAFLDQGIANWQLPWREEGMWRSFCKLYQQGGGPPDRWLRGLGRELARLAEQQIGPFESILESLDALGVPQNEWDSFLQATLLALRGWGGMVAQVEQRGDRVVRPIPPGSLVDFAAVRLLLDRFAVAHVAREHLDFHRPLAEVRAVAGASRRQSWPPSVEQRAFLVFQLAQIVGLSPDVLYRLNCDQWATLLEEIETFDTLERRRIFHLAYEKRFATQTLDAISLHARNVGGRPESPRFQLCCCIDEREESFRRHLEEVAPDVETFGAAGFYNVAMYYRGAADAHYAPLCPVVIRPQHWVAEEVDVEAEEVHRRRARTRRALGTASHRFHIGSRTFAVGALLSGMVGVLASFPLVARILFPRLTGRIRQILGRVVQTPVETGLHLERSEPTPGSTRGHIGYSVDEMTETGERLLCDIGLTSGFSRLVILLGHGSNSQNNPHNSAYNCGACGGSAGGPNARAAAQILNDPRVRQRMAEHGLDVPADTVFVGGNHNTCSDSVSFADLDRLPQSHAGLFEDARSAIEQACARNAHERCRRFLSAPLTLSFEAAREHVEGRAEDLAQTRPELGHATNAITIVGRREWTRGLFLDRRAFLTSYDPMQDDADSTILMRLLGAVFPVCAGINLEYYFSHVDNLEFGSGTKLPHNIAALLGVMDGAASDLRTGLPWQMVEIHEPVRSLFLIETTPDRMLAIMDRNAMIGRLCRNGWVLLSVIDPESRAVSVFQDGRFRSYRPQASVLPKAASSTDWYWGWRDHLEFAEIGPK